MSKWFAIRCDANPQIGLGHFMRCFALAEHMHHKGYQAFFFMLNPHEFCIKKVLEIDAEILELNEKPLTFINSVTYQHSDWLSHSEISDANQCLFKMKLLVEDIGSKPEFLVVDHYAIGAPWERILSTVAKIIAFDDLNDRKHECHTLVDQTYGKNSESYNGLIGKKTKILLGLQYAILRKEFLRERRSLSRKFNGIKTILITLGGVDKRNYTSIIIDSVLNYQARVLTEFNIVVVVSSLNPNIKMLKEYQVTYEYIEILVNPQNIAQLMVSSDFCFGAVGSTTWERFALSLPSALCVMAENQVLASNILEKKGLVRLINIVDGNISKEIAESLDFFSVRENYDENIMRISELVDCLGLERIVNIAMDKKL